MMREPEPETPPTWRSFCGYAIAGLFLTLLIVSALARAEGRPLLDGEPFATGLVLVILSVTAGACFAGGRVMLFYLRELKRPTEPLPPEVEKLRGQYRLVYGFGVAVLFVGAGFLLLTAVSLASGHREWIDWIPHRSRYRPY
ncbi:MAG: hypothetical protein RL749_1119 [Verrucomicrobiota bacterium]